MKIAVAQLQRGPCLRLIFSYAAMGDQNIIETDHININNLAEVRFKFTHQTEPSGNIINGVSWKKHESVPSSYWINKVQINITSEQLGYSQVFDCRDNWSPWKKMGELTKSITPQTSSMNALKVTLTVSVVEEITFPNLYLETEFCDFHLKSVDSEASVPVHKACLSLHSDVFKRMFHGEWKENKNGCIEIEGVTFQTLQDLKKYIYQGILPDDEKQLLPLLLLARYYLINNLMAECVRRLALSVKPQGLYSLQAFAIDNKIPELVKALVQIVPDETVQIAYQMENDKKKTADENKK